MCNIFIYFFIDLGMWLIVYDLHNYIYGMVTPCAGTMTFLINKLKIEL